MFDGRISRLTNRASPDVLWGGLKGVEKESLRVDSDGFLSNRPHPAALGSALTNRFITTDFSEALLEFVTPIQAQRSAWAGSLHNSISATKIEAVMMNRVTDIAGP